MSWLVQIDNDLFDIANRIKEIDDRYVICRNLKSNRFEIYVGGVLQIAVPFDRLDARTLELVRSTRLEYADRFIAQMDEHNEKLKRNKENAVRDRALARVKDVI